MRCPARQISMRLNIHNKILIAYMIFSKEQLLVTSVGRDRKLQPIMGGRYKMFAIGFFLLPNRAFFLGCLGSDPNDLFFST